ncbi:CBS domain-containing protein [Thalassotalea sp. PLHSN55]|uniref:CBS domain-containing protein n=1 Tax=Thalassotalea sp. PLHSN55 TaxID=3435888 RepID=UPI003F837354
MSVNKLMSKELLTLDLDEELEQAKQIFDTNSIHHILITEENKLVGLVTDRDVYQHLSPAIGTRKETHSDTLLLQKKLNLIMEKDLITAHDDISLNEAVVLFYDHNLSCLPIVNQHSHPVGIITWRDIIKVVALQYRKKLQASDMPS